MGLEEEESGVREESWERGQDDSRAVEILNS